MFLKTLELVGFKSFAEKTRLEFERGMTAIVGPNGCGKSNVSDAIRWALGEQSAKALRGGKMEDCIFSGTDTHKPLSMAEVSLTLSDCEDRLGTDFNEVTITRRVFRSGEGQYFINKAPCRLKDIQRLFMDTGVGTNSYSIMEQGKIDRVLSSRPEDRREVFEEASGITKYKSDKKEAIRKLEHTEANLLRLGDIIREVKRQIISLQRQVGKARRYKTLQEQLRSLDVFLGRERLSQSNDLLKQLETRLAALNEQEEALREEVSAAESQADELRAGLAGLEQEMGSALEDASSARTELERTREQIAVNRDRIAEFRAFSQRDERESADATTQLDQHSRTLEALDAQMSQAVRARDEADADLQKHAAAYAEHTRQLEELREALHTLRSEAVDIESRMSRQQNELAELESRERNTVLRRERLSAEKAEIERTVELHENRLREMQGHLAERGEVAETCAQRVRDLTGEQGRKAENVTGLRREVADLNTRIATRRAQIELLEANAAEAEGFPGGARLLLDAKAKDGLDRAAVRGALVEKVHAQKGYETALEAVLCACMDAVVVADDRAAAALIGRVKDEKAGSVRLLDNEKRPAATPDGIGIPLLDVVEIDPQVENAVRGLLARARVVDTAAEIPHPVAEPLVYVSRDGVVVHGDGRWEYWMAEEHEASPMARQNALREWRRELRGLEKQAQAREVSLSDLLSDEKTFAQTIEEARRALEDARRQVALTEGESQIIERQCVQARERAETIAWELESLEKQAGSSVEARAAIKTSIEDLRNALADNRAGVSARTDALRDFEKQGGELSATLTEHRVAFAEKRQQVEHLQTRREPLEARIEELSALIRDRSDGVRTYRQRIEELEAAVAEGEARLKPLQEALDAQTARLERTRASREEASKQLEERESLLKARRTSLDDVRSRRGQVDIEIAEHRLRRQNLIDRMAAEYHVTADDILKTPEPEWEDGKRPDYETLETDVAEIRTKLESMGPVNLVAIEEHKELEERFAFLTQQQDDLVKAKQQLMDLIRKINSTTTEMFSETFNKVNENFQHVFKLLFGGGSSKLVLVDEENVLESGIEIIARPPGKKLQTVSLLSGGERTMTAVALLFALYMVRPSPFCVLDEIDAALDESNIGRFVDMVKGFLKDTQFIVITHSRQTIGASDVLYGVTSEKQGISRIVSVKFSHHEKAADETEPAEPVPSPSGA